MHNIKSHLVRVIEGQPYLWSVAWYLIHKLTFLLPHDSTYLALKHFFNNHDNYLFVDIGANTGISALNVRKLNKNIPILSIEPNIIHEKKLQAIGRKLAQFNYKIVGVGDKEDVLTFYTPFYRSVALHTYTSCSQQQVLSALANNFSARICNKIRMIRSTAPVIKFDHMLTAPSVIKIDAEGFDYNVLIGSRETIKQHRPFIMIEVCHSSHRSFEEFFSSIDYIMLSYDYRKDEFSHISKCPVGTKSGERNIFAIPSEKQDLLPFQN